ncbi:MAG: SDR family NAD(P)-dependent oxidoreductase [Ruminococcaceae bacterium]|nr:SDR family NAD(P)-dependent oxidoreductase [Oscillospiraceae bacterium]
MPLTDIIALSNFYGSDPDYVLAGGGNTSVKEQGVLYVKASGTRLGDITAEGFVALSMEKLTAITEKTYSDDEKTAEAEVLADMMASRLPGMSGRPSVEALLHALFPQKLVVHLHPAAVNGVTCGAEGMAAAKRLWGEDCVWLDEIKPGYTLAMGAKAAMDAYKAASGKDADLLVMQNHGIFFASDTKDEITALIDRAMAAVKAAAETPDTADAAFDDADVAAIAPVVRSLTVVDGYACFFTNAALKAQSETWAGTTLCAMTPDHIVYIGHAFVCVDRIEDLEAQYAAIEAAVKAFVAENGYVPKVVVIKGLGAFACASSWKDAQTIKALFNDFVKINAYAASFGGAKLMADSMIAFIRNWEVESYRKSVSMAGSAAKRMAGKIAIMTGGAQGFGAGLAEELCKNGASVVIADINMAGAEAFANTLNEKFGAGSAAAAACDVSNEESVKALMDKTCAHFGGLDVFVSNAGIVRSGGLEEMDAKTFDLMTRVNYVAFFHCTKYASRVMKLETRFAPGKICDVIQINSKSGLTGSNKNFAYAGAKFGGIGLVQSFALELIPYNIKVNAICPGNFLNGPLWMDPERGLFVQYLRAGKVPGAKTVEDVKRFYEAKVPMNRGCEIEDVVTALFYAIEQKYETGQAIPVTGGQNMLK